MPAGETVPAARRVPLRHRAGPAGWLLVLGLTLSLHLLSEQLPWAVKYPRDWVVPARFWISDFMKWLVNELDFGPFTFKELTRSLAWLLTWPLEAARSFLATGFVSGLGDEARELSSNAIHRVAFFSIQ